MQDSIRVIAGQCTVTHEGDSTSESEGQVVVLVKPDNTVLVHDATGYRPAGWLTRAESVQLSLSEQAIDLRARIEETELRVTGEDVTVTEFPATVAGPAVGTCPTCGAQMVRAGGEVVCLGCGDAYALPRDATVTDRTCSDCGLPTISVTRGAALEVCLDRRCDPIDEAVRERFDGEWACPTCGSDLEIDRQRTLGARCPNCEVHYPIPDGVVDGTCACGLPVFETDHGRQCLDPDCTLGDLDADSPPEPRH
ncbi:DNA topoisomerase I [Halodesulfurarchaeum formicicum]|uniref:DNA topoisomerase I n=1 Tax=Halodesulfurarchaeum formicicum TaxID=1873524 RepID=A0A1D8S238_9EURY|nr:endonuclease NucS domain-containing protein [Halodesulfurarchaeum formicicum]AOW79391.1 DNA topoisomerase I [Halodesulfurarchaeum formicicum]